MNRQGYDPEAIGSAGASEAVAERRGLMDTVRGTRLGEALAVAGVAVALGGANEAVNANTAKASAGNTVNADVVKLKMNLKGVQKFIKKCRTSASRRDFAPVAPPADPLAKCNKTANVRVKYRAKLACPSPYLGGSISVSGSVRQRLRAKSLAKSPRPSIVTARGMISDKIEYKVKGSLTCVKITEGDKPTTPDTPTTPTTPPSEQPKNNPPKGFMNPPKHRYPNSEGPVCVDGISDPDGDAVTASNFDFENTNGQDVGQVLGGVFTMPGSNGETQCVRWRAPGEPMQVTASADLSDGRGGGITVMDNLPVIPNQQ
ncbi:MAG: hypothetical protein WD885_01885 [Candidatus Saccharimonadales bacterium]